METHITAWIEILTLVALFTPLLSAILVCFIPSRYSWVITITAPFLLLCSTLAALLLLRAAWQTGPYLYNVPWFSIAAQQISAGLYIDDLSMIMVLIVNTISFLVHLYSTGYMAGDTSVRRYFAMLGFFTFAMLGLVLADNLLLTFIFWELVGFSSYLLIGHWTNRPDAAHASKKAFIINRIGDVGFLAGLLIIWTNANTLCLFPLEESGSFSWQTAAALCLFCGAIGKSAQFPLFTWLPDAMAGPTPVSALIHAATMVAAGVFLLARTYFLFTPDALNVVAVIGALTALTGSLAALAQYDLKKILAYSTISQLGLMVTVAGAGAPQASMLHLFTHAFFKAGLFLAAGAVIHTLHQAIHKAHDTRHEFDVQDIRNLGGLRKRLPVTFMVFVFCGASLAGIPFFSGFVSKDAIIAQTIAWAQENNSWQWAIVACVFITSFITVLYIFRLIWYVFIKESLRQHISQLAVTEAPMVMRIPMVILAAFSFWLIVSSDPVHSSGWLYTSPYSSWIIPALSTGWIFIALAVAYASFRNRLPGGRRSRVQALFYHSFYLDKVYVFLFVNPTLKASTSMLVADRRFIDRALHFMAYAQVTMAHLTGWFDKTILDGAVNGVAKTAKAIGYMTRYFQAGGKIQHYIFWSLLGVILLMLFIVRMSIAPLN